MKKFTPFLLMLFSAVFLFSCEDCDSVSIHEPVDQELDWLVYAQNDSALFELYTTADDEEPDTILYRRTGIYADNVPGDGYSIEDDCIEQLNTQVTNIVEDKARSQPFLATYILTKPDSLTIKIGVGNKETWTLDQSTATTQETIGELTFNNVYTLTGKSTDADQVKTVLFNKEFGFLKITFNNGKYLSLFDYKRQD